MVPDFAREAAGGFEEAGADAYALPFLTVLQSNSPQLKKDKEQFVEGAVEGDWYNTATQERFDGTEGLLVVPIVYQPRLVEWVPREAGGGYVATHRPEDFDLTKLPLDEKRRSVLPNGNTLVDTRYFYVIQILPDGATRNAVLAFTSTQLKRARLWMTLMSNRRFVDANQKPYAAPMYTHAYKLTTHRESNEKGEWMGVGVELVGPIYQTHPDIVEMARAFKQQIEQGIARVNGGQSAGGTELATDDAPF